MRRIEFLKGEYYHIYNRGVDRRKIFCDEKDYSRFLVSMKEFNRCQSVESLYRLKQIKNKAADTVVTPSLRFANRSDGVTTVSAALVEFIAYCLNPNHYHFIVRDLLDNGIPKFMHKLGMGYARYFNERYKRSGALFQGPFQSRHVNSDEYLLWLSAYVNGNTEIHKIAKAENYPWSSYREYKENWKTGFCNKQIILEQFKTIWEYKEFIEMAIGEAGKRKDEFEEEDRES